MEVHVLNDMKDHVFPNTKVPTQTDRKVCVQDHIDQGFPKGPSGSTLLTGYSDHVAFRLSQREV